MSILVEIAERADVSVEGVVRVLTREPVSDAIKVRVLDVLDDLTPEQTRAVQRFALAALHDIVDRQGDAGLPDGPPVLDPGQLALPVAAAEPDLLPSLAPDAALVQLSSVLSELAEAVRDLRRETDAERRERVDDLAVLIDLITTGWQGLDARLGRIERQVSRLESGRREAAISAPVRVAPPPVPPVPVALSEPAPAPPAERPTSRGRLPFVAALTLVCAGIVTLAVLQLASGGPDVSRLVDARESSSSTTGELPVSTESSTSGTPTTARPPAQRPAAPATTTDVLGTTSSASPRPKPPAATTAPGRPRPPRLRRQRRRAATTAPAATTARPAGFQPTRNWAWAPVPGADYYDVVFTRAGTVIYRATPTEPKLTLPDTVVFRPGPHRWVVRPGFGARSARNLGEPIVDSPFTVS